MIITQSTDYIHPHERLSDWARKFYSLPSEVRNGLVKEPLCEAREGRGATPVPGEGEDGALGAIGEV